MSRQQAELRKQKIKAEQLLKNYRDYPLKKDINSVGRLNISKIPYADHKALDITPEGEQIKMVEWYKQGKSYTVLGAAGTGKTMVAVKMIRDQIEKLPLTWDLPDDFYKDNAILVEHKYIKPKLPGFIVVTFTNRAGETAARALNINLELNQYDHKTDTWITVMINGEDLCHTAHATLQYQLLEKDVTVQNEEGDDVDVTKKVFQATRTLKNKLCPNIISVIIDEAGMLSNTYFKELLDALWVMRLQLVMLGDLSQLPAVGETSALINSLGIMDSVKLEQPWRYGGILLEWNTNIRTKKLVIPKQGKEDRTWGSTDQAGNAIVNQRTATMFSMVDKENKRSIVNYFYTAEESKNTQKALSKACKILLTYIINGKFTQGVDLLIIPQHVNVMGGKSVLNVVNSWLDMHYGRQNYLLNFTSGKAVIAVGDVINIRREQGIILGVEQTVNYKGLSPQEGQTYPTRDPDIWANIYEAHNNEFVSTDIDDMIEQMSTASGADLDIDAAMEELKEEGNLDDIDLDTEYIDSTPRQLSHILLYLDLSKLLIHLNTKYNEEDAYKIATNFISVAKSVCLKLDAEQAGQTIRHGHLLNVKKSLETLATFYDLDSWLPENLFIINSANSFPRQGERDGFQEGYFTGYQVQGSECPTIISIFHRKGYRSNMTGNEFIYTSNTRARKTIINIGDEKQLNGSLTKGGITYQTYPGITVEEKEATYLKLTEGKVQSPDIVKTKKIMKYLTADNINRKGGKWWEQPRYALTYIKQDNDYITLL